MKRKGFRGSTPLELFHTLSVFFLVKKYEERIQSLKEDVKEMANNRDSPGIE
jgi:hypothetical protein